MPKKKTKRRRRAKPARKSPARVKALAVIMMVLLIGGIAGVKFFETARGRVLLLDNGIGDYYAQVQDDIDTAMRGALARYDLDRKIRQRTSVSNAEGRSIRYRTWTVECGSGCDLISINLALTRAVRSTGAQVRRSREAPGGHRLTIDVGTRRYLTHSVVIRKRVRPVAAARPQQKPHPRIAVVIDDFGYSRSKVAADLLAMELPLSIAILPTLPQSQYALRRAKEEGKCVLLHLPMEAAEENGYDIAPIRPDMTDGEITALVNRYLDALPGIDGVNNHQGSLATEDRRVMELVLTAIGKRKLFFLDSLTSSKSVAYNTARGLGLRAARNTVFLDDDTEDTEVVEQRLRQLVAIAKKRGTAVGIGHPHRWTRDALESSMDYLHSAGVEIVFISELVH